MSGVSQPTFAPTNKLTAAIVAGVAYEFLQPAIAAGVTKLGEAVGIAWALGPNGNAVLMLLAMALAGYLIKDRPNV